MSWFDHIFGSPSVQRVCKTVKRGNVVKLAKLLASAPDLANAKDEHGLAPLEIACLNRDYMRKPIIEVLLAHGADPNVRDSLGGTPLRKAAVLGRKDIVELFLAKGADPNTKDINGNSVLHEAAIHGHRELVELLLARGAWVKTRGRKGRTPLHWAMLGGHSDVAELLIARGADPNAKDSEGNTAMDPFTKGL
ncbi:MAG TPA: ankyrin repeat domain-containing protein [Phycisphaerae bacterium]|nr:ankyrin repeat domain-containing protein [Phycisphaerae bacterium]